MRAQESTELGKIASVSLSSSSLNFDSPLTQFSLVFVDASVSDIPINVSFAIPVFNEESVMEELLLRVGKVLDSIPGDHDIVFADDGSTDRTLQRLKEAARKDPRIHVIALSRNFGHQAAISAALDHVHGEVVMVMDGDLQDTPESLPEFLAAHREGFDVVYAVRKDRQESWWMQWLYKTHYRLLTALADTPFPIDAGDFALLSRRVVDLIRTSPERQRYLRGLRSWYGFDQKGIPVSRQARHSGTTKYSFSKLFRLAFDGVFAFSTVPLRLAMFSGLIAVGVACLYAAYALFVRLFCPESAQAPPGFTALILAITFLSGFQLLFMGIIGEYIGRIYEEVKQRPHYVVKQTIHHPRKVDSSRQ